MLIPISEVIMGKTLGKGDFAEVSLANYKGQQVAVKIFQVNEENRICNKPEHLTERLNDEVAILTSLPKDPHFVALIGVMETGFLMEFVDDLNLEIKIRSECSYKLRMNFAEQAAECLVLLAKLNIIHCDLKSANFLTDKQNRLKLADFGLAKKLGNEPWVESKLGCVLYKSPEYLFKYRASKASEMFALGILLWELHTTSLIWPQCQKPKDLMRQLQLKIRPLFDNFAKVNHSCALISFGLWRELCEHRTVAEAALQQIKAMNVRLQTQENNTQPGSFISEIKSYFDKSPKQYWLDSCFDQNHEMLDKLFKDPEFELEWLLTRVEEKDHIHTVPIFAIVENNCLVAAIIEKALSKELLLLKDESQNCSFLAYLLKKTAIFAVLRILNHPKFTSELFELFFSIEAYHHLWIPFFASLPNSIGGYHLEELNRQKIANEVADHSFFQQTHLSYLREKVGFFTEQPTSQLNPAVSRLIKKVEDKLTPTTACQM